MKRRSMAIATGLLVVSAGFGVAAPAAADYPPGPSSISVSGCSDVKGGVKVKVKDMLRGTQLTISWAPPTGAGSVTTTTKSNGTANVTLPINKAGDYTITVEGTDESGSPFIGSIEVTVLASCSDDGATGGAGDTTGGAGGATGGTGDAAGGIADTGADIALLLATGLGALALGGGAVAVSRRRRSVAPETA